MVTHWMGHRGPKQPWPRIVRYLRDLTADMTPETLCQDHERIFTEHFGGE